MQLHRLRVGRRAALIKRVEELVWALPVVVLLHDLVDYGRFFLRELLVEALDATWDQV